MEDIYSDKRSRLPGLLCVAALLIIGLFILKDYGVSWDEFAQRHIGRVNLDFIYTGDDNLITNFPDRDHGAAFEVTLSWIEHVFDIYDLGHVVILRHISGFLIYLLSIWCGYLLALRLFRQQWLALVGLFMLVIQPRIFGHAFFNSKDVPFLALILISLYTICVALQGRRRFPYALAGAACGIAAGIRTMGALLIALTAILLLIDIIRNIRHSRGIVVNLALFILGASLLLYASWPAIWHHPFESIVNSFSNLSNFQRFKEPVLFDGKVYPAGTLPWYYAPVWIANSTPLVWLGLGLVGIILFSTHTVKRLWANLQEPCTKVLLLCLGCFLLPLLTVILFHSVLYDDWRHLYFIYPPFVLLGLYALNRLGRNSRLKVTLITICAIQALATASFMVSAHPFQHVYFNVLVPTDEEFRRNFYDYEYWGTSYKQGLEWILQQDTSASVLIVDTYTPVSDNGKALPASLRNRLRWTNNWEKGSYVLTTFRFHPADFPYRKLHAIKVAGSTVLQIYRIDIDQ